MAELCLVSCQRLRTPIIARDRLKLLGNGRYLAKEEDCRLVLLKLVLNLPQRQGCSSRHLSIDDLACVCIHISCQAPAV